MTRRVHLISSTADVSFTVQQVRPGYSGSEVWVREEELDRLREAGNALEAACIKAIGQRAHPAWTAIRAWRRAALAALDGEDGE